MSIDLASIHDPNDTMHFSALTWNRLFILANMFGWQPKGTLPCVNCENPNNSQGFEPYIWDGNYSTNDGQSVSDRDALNMAHALEIAIEHIPDARTCKVDEPRNQKTYSDFMKQLIEDGDFDSYFCPLCYFSGDAKQLVVDFTAFCHKGEFRIF